MLKAIDILLRDTTKEDAQRRRINEMAVRSEEANREGEVLTLAEAHKRSKALLKGLAADRSNARPAAAAKPCRSHQSLMIRVWPTTPPANVTRRK